MRGMRSSGGSRLLRSFARILSQLIPHLKSHRRASAIQTVVVPAYFLPGRNWDIALRDSGSIRYIILNPLSGPGSAVDGGYVNVVSQARKAGVAILGYVDTAFAKRDIDIVEQEVSRYREWYAIDGVFFDQTSPTKAHLSYYRRLARYTRQTPGSVVAFNPGVYPHPSYARLADLIVTFEGPDTRYVDLEVPLWARRHDADVFCHLIYATAAANLPTVLALARTHHVANVFVTDRNLDNPWDCMPSYWQQEVDSIAASNETAHYGGGFRRPWWVATRS